MQTYKLSADTKGVDLDWRDIAPLDYMGDSAVIAFWRRVQRSAKSAMFALLANVESVFTSSREAESSKCAAVVSVDSTELEVAN